MLQLLAGIGKLRVADATARALAVWSKQFAAQKRNFISSQRPPMCSAFSRRRFRRSPRSSSSPRRSAIGSKLMLRSRRRSWPSSPRSARSMASIGAWASGISESLIAIPHITRIRPLIASAAEMSDDRKPPGRACRSDRAVARDLPLSGGRTAGAGQCHPADRARRICRHRRSVRQRKVLAVPAAARVREAGIRRRVLRRQGDRHARHQRGAPSARRRAAERQAGDRQPLRQHLRRRPAAARTGVGGGAARGPR